MKTYNPKALNLEKLRYTDKRVTLGFKCSPKLKIELAETAEMNNISLSEYVESLVVNLPTKVTKLKNKVNELAEQVEFYENNPILVNLLESEFGKEHIVKTPDDKKIKIKINNISDVFLVMVNSFKSQ